MSLFYTWGFKGLQHCLGKMKIFSSQKEISTHRLLSAIVQNCQSKEEAPFFKTVERPRPDYIFDPLNAAIPETNKLFPDFCNVMNLNFNFFPFIPLWIRFLLLITKRPRLRCQCSFCLGFVVYFLLFYQMSFNVLLRPLIFSTANLLKT